MGGRAVIVLLAVTLLSLQPRAAAGDWLGPVISPIFKGVCEAVACGKGSCRLDGSRMPGYVCECDPGWTKITHDDHFQYLPCVIPNCTFNYSCDNRTTAPAPSLPPMPPSDHPPLDPCSWSHCGEGTCAKTSNFGYRCACRPGYANLLNATNFRVSENVSSLVDRGIPAKGSIRNCVLGADCGRLGIVLPNAASPSTSQSDQVGRANNGAAFTRSPAGSLPWILPLMLSVLAAAPRTWANV